MELVIPDFFTEWLASLKGEQATAMYLMAVNVIPPNAVSEAVLDATQAEGNVGE